METLTQKLHDGLKPLYEELINHCGPYCDESVVPFIMQWGKKFPTEERDGILFVGRATNDWLNDDLDVDNLFDGKEKIFNREDQMIWAENYNSAFWRVIRSVSKHFYSQDELNHVAWSNICKLAPNTGNPNNTLFKLQLLDACNILNKEVEILSPKFIVMMTGLDWADNFISSLNGNEWPSDEQIVAETVWSEPYKATVYKIANRYVLLTEHPQGKDEQSLIKCLIHLISQFKEI